MLGNEETLTVSAVCSTGLVLAGGYIVETPERPHDIAKLIPIASFPSAAETWTVTLVATANVQSVVLTVFATCTS